jgi:hypothetical protein
MMQYMPRAAQAIPNGSRLLRQLCILVNTMHHATLRVGCLVLACACAAGEMQFLQGMHLLTVVLDHLLAAALLSPHENRWLQKPGRSPTSQIPLQ